MQYAGLLQTIAVISMGFAGFAALVSTLSRVPMNPQARVHRVRTMVLISLFALLFSLFPFLPAAFDASEETTWRLSSALFGLGLASLLAAMWREVGGLFRAGLLREEVMPSWRLAIFFGPSGLLALAILVSALAGWSRAMPGMYLVGLFTLVFACSFWFLVMVIAEQPKGES